MLVLGLENNLSYISLIIALSKISGGCKSKTLKFLTNQKEAIAIGNEKYP
jgi:hypothetical protein